MEKEIVNKIQKFIQKNIDKVITLSDIAREVNYSPYYVSRIFKKTAGINIFDYIRKIRLTNSAKLLRDNSKLKIIDVAFDFYFDTHEGFTRAFAKEFDITPKTYQKSPIPIKYFVPYLVETPKKEIKKMETKTMFVQVIERPKRKAIILRGIKAKEYFEYCNEVGCDVWGILISIKEAINEPMGMWLGESLRKDNTSMYVQGVEVPLDYKGVVPNGFELIELPESSFIVFQSEAYDDNDYDVEISNAMKSIEKYNPESIGYTYDPNGYRFQYEPQGHRGYIEGRSIRKI